MLTPQDLQEVSFEKAKIGGYVMKSVDEFLEPLMDDYITLYKENAVLKSKMRLLVERLESYRAAEADMKAAAEQARKEHDELLAQARRESEQIVARANREAKSVTQDAMLNAETERLRLAKEATAEFVQAVEAQIARQQQALESLKALDLPAAVKAAAPKPAHKAYDYEAEQDQPKPAEQPAAKAEDIAAQIEQSVASITGEAPRPKSDPNAATRVMPALDERTTAKFANLKFGKNYQP